MLPPLPDDSGQWSMVYTFRGSVWLARQVLDKAIADFTEAIRLEPLYLQAYNNRALAWGAKKEYDKEIADLNQVIQSEVSGLVAMVN